MAKEKSNIRRLEIGFFDGVNTLVADNIGKKQELKHCENARSKTIGSIEKRAGTVRLGDVKSWQANYGIFYFNNSSSNKGMYRVSKLSDTVAIHQLDTSSEWQALTDKGTGLTAAQTDTVIAESCCFITNGTDNNRYINSAGEVVVDSDTTTGHLYNSPKAYKINYFKDKMYLGDYTVGSTRYKNGIMMSSVPVGLISLVDGDHDAAVTTLSVTDTKYIRSTDSLDVYRGGTKIETLTISAKTENDITVAATTNPLNSSDELWVADTYTGAKVFRWADNPASGTTVKQYDTFKLAGGDNDRLKIFTNIGDVMIMANNNNISTWNNSYLKPYDLGIGCVSDTGWVKALGTLWFVHYTGIYATTGESPKLMSAKVQKYIEGATKSGLEDAAAGRRGLSVFFAIGNVSLYKDDGSEDKTLSDVCLEYNMRQENWFIHTGIKASQFATYLESSDPDLLEYTSTNTKFPIFELFNGATDDNTVDETEIPFRIDTGKITLSKQFEKICYPTEIIIETERGSNIKTFISLDNGKYYELNGDAIKGCTILKVHNTDNDKNTPPRCRNLKLSFRDYSKSLCKIARVAIIYTETSEEEESRPDKE